jgi:hypothetical protein
VVVSVDVHRDADAGGVTGTLQRWVDRASRAVRRRVARLYFGDWFVILLTVGVAAVAGQRLAGTVGVALSLGLGLTVALAIGIAASRNPLLTVLGAGVTAVGGVLAAAVLAFVALLGVQSGVTGLVGGLGLTCLAMAGAGAFLTPATDVTNRTIARTVSMTGLAAAGVAAMLGARVVPDADLRAQAGEALVDLGGAGVGALVATSAETAVPTFLLTLGATAVVVRATQSRLPVERLVPADRRDPVSAALGTSRRTLTWVFRAGVLGGLATGVAVLVAPEDGAGAMGYLALARTDTLAGALPGPLGGLLEGLLLAESVRVALVVLLAVGLATVAAVGLARRLRRGLGWLLVRAAAPVAGGAATGFLAGTTLDDPTTPARLAAAAPDAVPPEVVALLADLPLFAAANALLLLAMLVFVTALMALLTMRAVLVLPARAGSAALASVGLFGVAVVAVLVGQAVLGVGVAVVALSVWDVGEYRTGLREELPDTAPTLQVEVVHASGSLLLGTVVAVLGWGVFVLAVPLVQPATPRVAAAGLLVVAAVTGLLLLEVDG